MTTLEDYLKEVYFKPGHPAAFAGPTKLWSIVKKAGYNPRLQFLKDWTSNQESYSLNKNARNKFTKSRVLVPNARYMYDADLADLMDLADANQGINYWLVVVDVFSKKLGLRTLKTKNAAEVKNAVRSVFEEIGVPNLLRTDGGREFDNKVLKKYLNDNGVRYQIARNQSKANFSERLIRTMKGLLYKYLTHYNTRKYHDVVRDLVSSYNNSVHRSTGMAPNEITKKIGKRIWWKMYRPEKGRRIRPFTLRAGDTVRVSYIKNKFTRDFDQKWTGEVFTIRHRYRIDGIPVYQLVDYNSEKIEGVFYAQELQKIDDDPDKLWKVEKVIRTRKRRGETEYLVKWLHWPEKFNSWVGDVQDV